MSDVIESLSETEAIKLASGALRGTIAQELENDVANFTEPARQLLKFHGSYEQDDRDVRRARKKAGVEPAYSYMVRSRIPGGVLTPEQYIAHDDIAGRFAGPTLRFTTRQTIQFHGILKGDLQATIRSLNEALISTLATCGDVNRNVMCCPAALPDEARTRSLELAALVSDRLLPRTRAYHEIWVGGEKVVSGEQAADLDPLYGEQYLPRKFKTGFALADDNCTDVYTSDLGFLAITADGRLRGYNVLVGGGLGRTHGKADTFPRLADTIAFVRPDEVIAVATAVLATQRDHGNRSNRRRARLKYLLAERGVDWFRAELERRLGGPLAAPVPVQVTAAHDHLGWHAQGGELWSYGVFVENGRVADTDTVRMRTGLRRVVERFRPGVRLTPQQNVLLTNIAARDRSAVESVLAEHGIRPLEAISAVRRNSMACPALPTCPLALAEAERVLPDIVTKLEQELIQIGLGDAPLQVRMTGCPNGCARPYNAEIAFVGRSLDKYVVYVGGNVEGTRLALQHADLVPRERLLDTLRPLLERYRDERLPQEAFGDFCARVGATEPELVTDMV